MYVGGSVYLVSHPRPIPRWRVSGSKRPQYFGTSYTHARAQYEKQQPNLLGDQTRYEENFAWSTTFSAQAQFFVTRMLTRDLFVIAVLLTSKPTQSP